MKKLKLLLVALLTFSFVLPIVNAEEKTQESTASNEVNVYIFKGETCGFCAAALEYFQGLEAEYGKYFELVQYEVWYNADNAALMEDVAEYLGTTVSGVPFIIIGDKYYNGFNEQLGKEMLDKIVAEYNLSPDKRTDVIKDFQSGKKPTASKDIVLFVAAIVGVGAMVTFVFFARRASEADLLVNATEEKHKKAKEVVVPEENEEEIVVEKKKTTKKSSSKTEKTTKKASTTSKKKASSSTKKKK